MGSVPLEHVASNGPEQHRIHVDGSHVAPVVTKGVMLEHSTGPGALESTAEASTVLC